MAYFVHYDDDYPENGGIGLEECETIREVSAFIEKRLKEEPLERKMADYTVIRGEKMSIEAVVVVTKVKVE